MNVDEYLPTLPGRTFQNQETSTTWHRCFTFKMLKHQDVNVSSAFDHTIFNLSFLLYLQFTGTFFPTGISVDRKKILMTYELKLKHFFMRIILFKFYINQKNLLFWF